MRGKNHGDDPAYIQKRKDAERKEREGRQHRDNVQIVLALNRLRRQISSNEKEEKGDHGKRGWREWLTIALVSATVVATGIGDRIFYVTMKDARRATAAAHADSAMALHQVSENFIAENRPIMWRDPTFHNDPEYTDRGDGTAQVSWTFHYRNFGKLTAMHLHDVPYLKMGDDFVRSCNRAPFIVGSGIPVPPDDGAYATAFSCSLHLSRQEFDALLAIEGGLAMKVVIYYQDPSGHDYETGLCYAMGSNGAQHICDGTYIR